MFIAFLAAWLFLPAAAVANLLDRLDDHLAVRTADGLVQIQASGLVDLEGYVIDRHPPGLLFGGDDPFLSPRFRLFLDTRIGNHLYSLVQVRADRGFDPRSDSASIRVDEYLLRYTPFPDSFLNVQVGKFATVIGNWVERHDSWSNPLINAPVPYENVTIVSDGSAAATPAAFLARRNLPDRKGLWLPLLWGPAYTTGASAFGRWRVVQYAAEVKNAAPSSRPSEWDGRGHGFERPTVAGRLGVHPDAAWTVGASFSRGSYLLDSARTQLPPGKHPEDLHQTLLGVDASYAWRRLELWSELFLGRFQVPAVGDADTLTYYVEGRMKLSPGFFAAWRWNQQLFATVSDGAGRKVPWDRDLWRVDAGFGYRFDRHWQAKLEYGYGRQRGRQQQGEQLAAIQLTFRY